MLGPESRGIQADMTERNIAFLILAAGKGTRMKSRLPKVLHKLAGLPLVGHVVRAAEALGPQRIGVVVGPDMEAVSRAVAPYPTVVQERRDGTGGAVRAGLPLVDGFDGDVIVLYGDTPMLTDDVLKALIDRRRGSDDPAVVALGMEPADPARYGRFVTDATGALLRIVEFADANEEERAITLVNSGLMAFDGKRLPELIGALENNNAQGEFYLTDVVAHAQERGWRAAYTVGPEAVGLGIDSRAQLAFAEGLLQDKLRRHWMAEGVTMTAPETVFLCADTVLNRDVEIGPFCRFGPGVTIEEGVEIHAFSHLEGASVAAGAVVGPYARLRPGSVVGQGARVGNFVEMKNTVLSDGAKANHLTYLGDATVGEKANIGAGTITCNYDGFVKSKTRIGAGAFIGSNSALVAPVEIGDGAIIGAGSTITRSVAADALAVSRGRAEEKPGWAAKFRRLKAAAKAKTSGKPSTG